MFDALNWVKNDVSWLTHVDYVLSTSEILITWVVFVLWTPFQACLASADTERVQVKDHMRVQCVWNGLKVMFLCLLVWILPSPNKKF